MIITKQKPLEEILRDIGSKPVFLVGCSQCATLCHTGGNDEVIALKEQLSSKNIPVSGHVVLDPACHRQNNKRILKDHVEELKQSEKILVLACGNGIQTIAGLFPEKQIIAGTDTLFLGEILHASEYQKRCVMCGECLLDLFGGLCPVSQCPKSMLNGPCGGSSHGACEINPQVECVWDRIIQHLKKQGKLHLLTVVQPPKNWSKAGEINRRI